MSDYWQTVLVSGTTSFIAGGFATGVFVRWYHIWYVWRQKCVAKKLRERRLRNTSSGGWLS